MQSKPLLIEQISRHYHVKTMLCSRFVSFCNSLQKSSKLSISNSWKNDHRTVLCQNLTNLLIVPLCNCVYKSCNFTTLSMCVRNKFVIITILDYLTIYQGKGRGQRTIQIVSGKTNLLKKSFQKRSVSVSGRFQLKTEKFALSENYFYLSI